MDVSANLKAIRGGIKTSRKGYAFFQGLSEAAILRCGSRVTLGLQPTGVRPAAVAEIEGAKSGH